MSVTERDAMALDPRTPCGPPDRLSRCVPQLPLHRVPQLPPQCAPDQRGFTLIELMIVVAIVAILAAIAIPSYQDSVWKGKRGEAKAAIMRTMQTEERSYTQSNQYYLFTSQSQATQNGAPFSTYSADNAANSRYTITTQTGPLSVPGPPPNNPLCGGANSTIDKCVIVKATVNGSADPNCGSALYMDSMGNKGSDLSPYKDVCWR